MPQDLSTGDLARATGNTARTIRFYEQEGLLRPAQVREGGRRHFTEDDLERLRLITDLRELGLSICDIRAMLALREGCTTAAEFAARFRGEIERHLAGAQRRLERLRRMKREIQHSLAVIEERLRSAGTDGCPCAVADAEGAPRIVKVLARLHGCGCGGSVHADHAPPAPGRADDEFGPIGLA